MLREGLLQSADISGWRPVEAARRIAIHEDPAELEGPWTELERQAGGTVFQSHAWCRAWATSNLLARRQEPLRIVTIWKGRELVFLWPLMLRRMHSFRVLCSLGDPATQTSDALVAPGHADTDLLDMAVEEIRRSGVADAVMLKGVRSDAALATPLAERFATGVTRAAEAPFVAFGAQGQDNPRKRSGRTRNGLQRHMRNLAEHGPVTFTVLRDAESRVGAVCTLLKLKEAWLERTGKVSAGYGHPANRMFLEQLAAEPDFFGLRLDVGGETAALEAGILRNGYYWSLMQSYDTRFAAHGPGRLLFWHLIENAEEHAITVLDFLAPATRHKDEWATGRVETRDYVIPLNLYGRMLIPYFRSIRPRVKQLLESSGTHKLRQSLQSL